MAGTVLTRVFTQSWLTRNRAAWLAMGLGMMWVLSAAPVVGAGSEFRISSADTRLVDGVYRLEADVDLGLSEAVREALNNGVALTIVLDFEVVRPRDYWFDEVVASLRQRFRIRYHPLSQRYVVSNLNTGTQANFHELDEALEFIGDLRNFPLIDDDLLRGDDTYFGQLRAGLNLEDLPAPLYLQARFSPSWYLSTGWFEWPLKP
jgi:hypothetical protein